MLMTFKLPTFAAAVLMANTALAGEAPKAPTAAECRITKVEGIMERHGVDADIRTQVAEVAMEQALKILAEPSRPNIKAFVTITLGQGDQVIQRLMIPMDELADAVTAKECNDGTEPVVDTRDTI